MKTAVKTNVFMVLAALFLLLLRFSPTAALAAPLPERKGARSAWSTDIDRSVYADAADYDNGPCQVETLRIGLNYGDTAVREAEFSVPSGEGFSIGFYGDDRNFVKIAETEESDVVFSAEDGLVRIESEDRAPIYEQERGGPPPAVAPQEEDGLTRYGEDSFRGGFECLPAPDGLLTVINVVGLEDYVKGVIPYEMGPDWPYEALKAQALCARTYAAYRVNEFEDQGFDLTGDTRSQVYRGVGWASGTTDSAVDSTAGQFVRYRGGICEVYYFAADGGATEDGACVFGSSRPYLTGKADPFEAAQGSPFSEWTVTKSGAQLAQRLRRLGYDIGTVTGIEPEYSWQGNVTVARLSGGEGESVSLSGRECYSALGLNSCRYAVRSEGGDFIFSGSGLGHSCGMSQWGAHAMASVYGYDCEDIIRFYFTGAYIA